LFWSAMFWLSLPCVLPHLHPIICLPLQLPFLPYPAAQDRLQTPQSVYLSQFEVSKPVKRFLDKHSLYSSYRNNNKQYSCLTPLPILAHLYPWYSHSLTYWNMCILFINYLSRQSVPFIIKIWINLLQFKRWNDFHHSIKYTNV
jgi:hypothetical protein